MVIYAQAKSNPVSEALFLFGRSEGHATNNSSHSRILDNACKELSLLFGKLIHIPSVVTLPEEI